jgi:predicted GNAT family N-acyltransferase
MRSECAFRVERVEWAQACSELRAIRLEVFVREQSVPEALEWDGLDPQCEHVLASDSAGHPIATGRLLPDGHIGRMAVLKDWRRRGVGSAVLSNLLKIARARGDEVAVLHAQSHATQFYRRAGFEITSAEFMEAGIAHVEMRTRLIAG